MFNKGTLPIMNYAYIPVLRVVSLSGAAAAAIPLYAM